MEFWKMNGAGNDFIVVDDRRNAIPENRWPEIVRVLCERHMSIGADGFMVVKPPTCGGDYKMLFFNSDGSIGEMCGNGARCICRYGYENGLAGETQRVSRPSQARPRSSQPRIMPSSIRPMAMNMFFLSFLGAVSNLSFRSLPASGSPRAKAGLNMLPPPRPRLV